MNFSDSEIVASILIDNDFTLATDKNNADIVLINTCSVRDNAEQKVWHHLNQLKSLRKKNKHLFIGVIGCMAERVKEELLEKKKLVDLIAGPDSYRNLPNIISSIYEKQSSIFNLQSPISETYDDIQPYRLDNNHISAFISVMRGCENFCTYCVVPFTRGKERSRNPESIINDAKTVFNNGFREVTLLGQNVNSYNFSSENKENEHSSDFSQLIAEVAEINPLLRVRFSTSHPKDLSDDLIKTIAKYDNICKSIHLPIQSGSNRILKLMNRKYTAEDYMERISAIRKFIPECAVSTDIITGFSTESDEDHQQTLAIIEKAAFDYAYMFKYSVRSGTIAAKKYTDDVLPEIKSSRLNDIIHLQQKLSLISNKNDLGKTTEVLAESISKRSSNHLMGRNSQNKVVIFPRTSHNIADYVSVKITGHTSATLFGEPI